MIAPPYLSMAEAKAHSSTILQRYVSKNHLTGGKVGTCHRTDDQHVWCATDSWLGNAHCAGVVNVRVWRNDIFRYWNATFKINSCSPAPL